MESQPQNPEFRINPANFHPCLSTNQLTLVTNCIKVSCITYIIGAFGWFTHTVVLSKVSLEKIKAQYEVYSYIHCSTEQSQPKR